MSEQSQKLNHLASQPLTAARPVLNLGASRKRRMKRIRMANVASVILGACFFIFCLHAPNGKASHVTYGWPFAYLSIANKVSFLSSWRKGQIDLIPLLGDMGLGLLGGMLLAVSFRLITRQSEPKMNDWTPLPQDMTIAFILPLIALIGILFAMILPSLSYLQQQGRIGAFAVALSLGVVGICLLFLARLPMYCRGQFFTYGPRQLDPLHRKLYWWGHGVVAVSVLMLFWLLVSVW